MRGSLASVRQERTEDRAAASLDQRQNIGLVITVDQRDVGQCRIEGLRARPADAIAAGERDCAAGNFDGLRASPVAVVDAECDVDQCHVEAEEDHHRPGTQQKEDEPRDRRNAPEDRHHDQKATLRQRTVRQQRRAERQPHERVSGRVSHRRTLGLQPGTAQPAQRGTNGRETGTEVTVRRRGRCSREAQGESAPESTATAAVEADGR